MDVRSGRPVTLKALSIPVTKGSNMKWRPVGLGTMGLQDVFFALGISFDSVSYFWADPVYGLRASDKSNQILLRTQWQLFF